MTWQPCRSIYCEGCYRTPDDDPYPIRRAVDEDGLVVESAADADRFKYGRAGDNFMTMFQCDLCHFRNIQERDPVDGDELDVCALRNIRRANMDALWSREPSTVRTNLATLRKFCSYGEGKLGYDTAVLIPTMGPFPVKDDCGMRVASVSTERSLDKGVNEKTVQHGTVRKFRSVFSNMWHASVEGGQDAVAVRNTSKLIQTSCPTFGEWFERFGLGLHKRMGDVVRQDRAVSVDVMRALMEEFEKDWKVVTERGGENEEVEKILFPALFAIVAYVVALRGEEVPLMDVAGTRNHFSKAINTVPNEDGETMAHVVIALLGRFKGEKGEKHHYMVSVIKTKSGLEPAKWVGRMLKWYHDKGVTNGPVFRKRNGSRAKAKDYEVEIFDRLERIQKEQPGVLDPSIDITEEFGLSRSFRRGSDSRAIAEEVPVTTIDLNNRWRKVESAKGKAPSFKMFEHYADIELLLGQFLRYSRAM
jgi:hypothetical protein